MYTIIHVRFTKKATEHRTVPIKGLITDTEKDFSFQLNEIYQPWIYFSFNPLHLLFCDDKISLLLALPLLCMALYHIGLSPAAYQITYRRNSSNSNAATVDVLSPSARQYTATGLKPETVYVFRLTAQTRKGWGEAAEALVVTTEKRGREKRQLKCFILKSLL